MWIYLLIFCYLVLNKIILPSLNNLNLLLHQSVQLIHQLINGSIRRLNLPGQHRPFLFEPRILQFPVQVQHLGDEGDHAIMAGDISGV